MVPRGNNRLCPVDHPRRRNSSSCNSTARSLFHGNLEQRKIRNLLHPREPTESDVQAKKTSRSQHSPVHCFLSTECTAGQVHALVIFRHVLPHVLKFWSRSMELDSVGRHLGDSTNMFASRVHGLPSSVSVRHSTDDCRRHDVFAKGRCANGLHDGQCCHFQHSRSKMSRQEKNRVAQEPA